jgi:N utilization substance protein B
MRLIYQTSVTDDWSDDAKALFLKENASDPQTEFRLSSAADKAYFNTVFDAVRENLSEIDAGIGGASAHWKLTRIAKVDLAIIRLAVAEMLYADGIPVSVSINEAVDLARKYGGEKSYEFVNGVLGKIAVSS